MARRKKTDEESDDPVAEPIEDQAVEPSDPVAEAETTTPAAENNEPDPAEATQSPARGVVTVKFIGEGRAVLGNQLILHGETRDNVSRAALERAEKAHPGEFEIIG